jgi:23S rRNA pseudoU1915 N3-methylase RlmH
MEPSLKLPLAQNYLVVLDCDLSFQIAEVKSISTQDKNKARAKALEAENEKLRKEIEEWKNKLIKLEIASGIKQVMCQFICVHF